jgi:amino acid transporter
MIFKKIIIKSLLFSFIFSLVFVSGVNKLEAASTPESTFVVDSEEQMGAFKDSSGFSSTSAPEMTGSIITMVLSLLAIVFIILMIYSGFQWMTAGGNEEQVKKAQSRIKNAVIGLIIIVLAYGITALVFRTLPSGGGGTTEVESSG